MSENIDWPKEKAIGTKNDQSPKSSPEKERERPPALTFDPEEYVRFVVDHDLTEEQSQELLATIWRLVVTFVDLGFGIEPAQQAIEAKACCVKELKTIERGTR